MQDLKHIRTVTGNYSDLQGLRKLPIALSVLILSLIYPIWDPSAGRLNALLFIIPGAIGAWWLSRRIGAYYDATFGQVQPMPRS